MNFWKKVSLLLFAGSSSSMAAMEFKEAQITTIKNMVEHDSGTGAAPAKVNDKIHEKSKVSTAAASMAELTFADTSITRMGANTQFSFQSKERLVKLEKGTVLVHTPPGNGGAVVEAGGVTGAVSGTTFMASRDGAGNVMFVLLEGQGGLKVTVGGATTVIRPGQAASVGSDVVKESKSISSSDTPAAGEKPGTTTASGAEDTKSGGGSAGGQGPAASGVGSEGGSQPPATSTPKIQVFEVDVQKVVSTTPLIVEFKNELPSASKIEKTVEVQQKAVQEGKLEKLEVEVVAVKSTDGDVMVGAPQVEQEEMVVVNKNTENVGRGAGGDSLDIDTAAGPGAGGPAPETRPAPSPVAQAPAPPSSPVNPVNPGQNVLQPPPAASKVAVTARVNDASRPFGQENPGFGFSIVSGSLLAGHSLVTDFLTPATRTSGVANSPFAVNFSNARVLDASGADVSSRYDLTTLPGVLNLVKAGQSVNFGSVGSLTFGQSVDLVASALGGSVDYEVVSGLASVVNGKLLANSGTGSVVVRAVTLGNENYEATSAVQTITLAKAGQAVAFSSLGSLTFGQSVDLVASALGGNVSYEVVSGPASVVDGKLVANSGTGSVVVRAVTLGNDNYLGANAEQTISLAKAGQVLDFGAPGARLTGSTGSIPVSGVKFGSATLAVLEKDGRATVDTGGVVTIGKILGADSFTLRASALANDNYLAGTKDQEVAINRNVAAIQAANPVRQLVFTPDANDLAGLDDFFYFNGKATGFTGGPERFYSTVGVGDTDRTLSAPGLSTQLYSGQTWDFFAGRNFTAGPGLVNVAPSAGKTEVVYYGDSLDLGAVDPVWVGTVDPRLMSTSLGSRYLTLNEKYSPVFLSVIDAAGEPYGFFNNTGDLFFPLENFPVWDDAGGAIQSAASVQVKLGGLNIWTLVAGRGGLAARGLDVDAGGASVQMLTSGDLELKTSRLSGISPAVGGEALTLEAAGKVRMGTDAAIDLNLDTNAGLAEQQQVRLEAQTDAVSGTPQAGNLAVVRTGDALELRNVTIRGFSETSLEKVNLSTKTREGRVLISGSAVRDFKIKELVGAAVNADAKIQMMALDGTGALAGDMVVQGKMPVEAKLASALAEVGEILPSETANAMVDAKQIDLAARNLKFENANLVAMNSITARANTILVQNSFMTVVRNQGMINMYVQSGMVNTAYGSMVDGRVNFAGMNQFRIGNTSFAIGNQAELTAAYGNNLLDFTHNGGTPQAGKVNVLKL